MIRNFPVPSLGHLDIGMVFYRHPEGQSQKPVLKQLHHDCVLSTLAGRKNVRNRFV